MSAMPKHFLFFLFVLIVGTGHWSCAVSMTDGAAALEQAPTDATNEVSVDPSLAKQIKKSGGEITLPDPVLEKNLRKALAASQREEVARLKLKVVNGRVLLHGPVATLEQRNLAESIVRASPGVKGVHARVKVTPHVRTSPTFRGDPRGLSQITSDKLTGDLVRRRLAESPHVASSRIRVEVYDQVVVLSGYARSAREKKLAEEIALFTDSVRSVVNQVRILPKEL